MSDLLQYSDWVRYSVTDIVRQFMDFRGRTPLKLGMQWGGGEIRALSANNVQMGRVDFSKEAYFGSEELYRRWMTKGDVEKGDVLLTTEAPLGNVAQVPDAKKYILSQRTILLKLNRSKACPEYVFHLFQGALFQSELLRLSTGTTVVGIQQAKLARIELLLPPLPEQRKIARILTTLNSLIEKTEALITKYQAIKQGTMHDLFTRGVDVHGHLRPTQADAPNLYKQSALGWIPKEWEIKRIERLTTKIVDGVHHTPTYVESGVPFVTVKNLTFGDGINFGDINYITESDHREYWKRADSSPGDVLVTKDGTLGVARIVPDGVSPFSIFVSVALLRPDLTQCNSKLIWLFFDSGAFLPQLGRLSAGTGLQHIHLEHFREFQVKTPPLPEQNQIIQRLDAQQHRLAQERDYLGKLRNLKTGLMQDLLTGKV